MSNALVNDIANTCTNHANPQNGEFLYLPRPRLLAVQIIATLYIYMVCLHASSQKSTR